MCIDGSTVSMCQSLFQYMKISCARVNTCSFEFRSERVSSVCVCMYVCMYVCICNDSLYRHMCITNCENAQMMCMYVCMYVCMPNEAYVHDTL